MGIADRDYTQDGRGGGGMGPTFGGIPSPRLWSFNMWLIVINVAVFMLGSLIGATVPAGFMVSQGRYLVSDADTSNVEIVRDPERVIARPVDLGPPPLSSEELARPIVERSTNTQDPDVQVGWQVYRVFRDPFKAYGHFSTQKGFLEFEVWRLVAFQFLHANVWHLLFNMMGLYFFGPLVERFLKSRMLYAAFYLTCGIFGAVLYLTLNIFGWAASGMGMSLPGVLDVELFTPLIGASAGVFGVLMASAYIAPKATMLIFGFIPMTVRTGAYLFVALAAINLIFGGNNAGGDAAHLGGAAAGFFFIRRPHLLLDFFDGIIRSKPDKRGRPAKVVKNRSADKPRKLGRGEKREQKDRARMDELLAKVGTQGLGGLSDKERRELDEISKRLGD